MLDAINETDDDVDRLRSTIAGTIVRPSDAEWNTARTPWNSAIDQRPTLIALPESPADVMAVVDFARRNGMKVAPQCLGHNAGGVGPVDEKVVLVSMVRMTDVSVDPRTRTVRAQAGALWGSVVEAIDPHDLFALSGSSADVGVVGYTLGGGLSMLGRKYGLAANHVTSIDVVTPDGVLRTVSATADPDLFWALRGGGANFGVVTAIEFSVVADPDVNGGMFVWPYERRLEVLRAWHEWTVSAPREISTSFRIVRFPPLAALPPELSGRTVVIVDGVSVGENTEVTLSGLRALAPEIDTWARCSPLELNHLHLDPTEPTPSFSTTALLGGLDDAGAQAFSASIPPGSPLMFVELRHLGGALSAPPPAGGAISTVDGAYLLYSVGIGMSSHDIQPALDAIDSAMAPYATGMTFGNFTEHPVHPKTVYPTETLRRLRRVRALHDPSDTMLAVHPILLDASSE